jgi:hypothetical protein
LKRPPLTNLRYLPLSKRPLIPHLPLPLPFLQSTLNFLKFNVRTLLPPVPIFLIASNDFGIVFPIS